MTYTHTLIIGASAAGLASAVCLQKEGIDFILLEKNSQVGNAWRNHYDRLSLHTSKKWSALPYKKFDDQVSKYPTRNDVISYLENYVTAFNLKPHFNSEVLSVKKVDGHWITKTASNHYQSKFVILATGLQHTPNIPTFEGLHSFTGITIHSSQYKNGEPFREQEVLVVGFGNSGCEQAICLHEHGAHPSLSVRSEVNVIPRDIFGFPVLEIGKITSFLPARWADRLTAPILRILVGDITKWGLKKSKYGPKEQIEKLARIPLLDIGTMKLIKQGKITVYGNISRIEGSTVYFEDGKINKFDAIIFATGYTHGLENILDLSIERLNILKTGISNQSYFGKDGMYFCGFYVSPMGMLREIGIEAKKIAKDIALKTTTLTPAAPAPNKQTV